MTRYRGLKQRICYHCISFLNLQTYDPIQGIETVTRTFPDLSFTIIYKPMTRYRGLKQNIILNRTYRTYYLQTYDPIQGIETVLGLAYLGTYS